MEMESEPDGPYPDGDDELSRQREKRTTALVARWVRHPSRRTDEALEAMTGTGTVVELPVRRSCTTDADTDGAAGVDLTRLSSVVVGACPTEGQALSSARRLQLLRRLQAMLPPE